MKKHSAAFLSLCLIVVCLFPTCTFAANAEEFQRIVYFDDGSYVITTVSVTNTAATRASKTRVGSVKHDCCSYLNPPLFRQGFLNETVDLCL